MPHSTPIFKVETAEFVKKKFDSSHSALDIGAGAGLCSEHLRSSLGSFDGVEIFEPYIEQFGLRDKYDQIFIEDALSFDFDYYDLIVVGDVLEHMDEEAAVEFIQSIYNKCEELIVSIPFESVQDISYDNKYEIHLQDKLTHQSFLETYPGFRPLALRYDYGVYIKDTEANKAVDIIVEEDTLSSAFPKNNLFELYPFSNILRYEDGKKVTRSPPPSSLTIVSGLWDIDRAGRDFPTYKDHFSKFLEIPHNMILFIPQELENFVWERRSKDNTVVKIFELEDIKELYNPFWDKTQEIRQDPAWLEEAPWLPTSPQACNEWYNPIVMSKYSLLHTATCWNHFETDYFLWIDAGITLTVYENYFTDDNVLNKILPHLDPFLFLSYPYEANTEIHGFKLGKMNDYAGEKVDYVCRGGFFGGHRDTICEGNSTYWHLLNSTLQAGYMGTEECIFTIMAYQEPHLYKRYSLDENGLIIKFIQALAADDVELEKVSGVSSAPAPLISRLDDIKTNLYFLTFNFPEQLEETLKSFKNHPGFLPHPTCKIVIDNSTSKDARLGNAKICEEYGFSHIIREKNTGICGGRQFAAEHFNESEGDFYLFFEDDMQLSSDKDGFCRNGLRKYLPKLYLNLHQIMLREGFDFLKLSFAEVYMDNNIQTSWYNVPQDIRSHYWPNYSKLPETGLDPHSPRTKFDTIERLCNGVAYITGEIYYSNWPMIVSREGNKKMFIDTTWAHPFEQTWMSHIFQETKKGNITPSVLLASPVTHKRISHYEPEDRREN